MSLSCLANTQVCMQKSHTVWLLLLSFAWTVLLKEKKSWQRAKQCYTQAFLIGNKDVSLVPPYPCGYWWHVLGCLEFALSCLWGQRCSSCCFTRHLVKLLCNRAESLQVLFQRQPSLEAASSLQGRSVDFTTWDFLIAVGARECRLSLTSVVPHIHSGQLESCLLL